MKNLNVCALLEIYVEILRPRRAQDDSLALDAEYPQVDYAGNCELGLLLNQIENLLAGYAANLDAFVPAVFAALDSNSRFGGCQKFGEKFDQCFVSPIFDRRRTEANLQRAVHHAGNLVFAGAGLHANQETDRPAQ